MVTATSEWDKEDVIGGSYSIGDKTFWRPGLLLTSLARHLKEKKVGKGALLIIEELNRTDLYRAFGELITILSSSPDDRVIPRNLIEEAYSSFELLREQEIEIFREAKEVLQTLKEGLKEAEDPSYLRIPRDFRIIGTMNTFDRSSLISMGFALLRCFSHVFIEPPSSWECLEKEKQKSLSFAVKTAFVEDDILREAVEELNELIRDIRGIVRKPIGTGILLQAASIMGSLRSQGIDDVSQLVSGAFKMELLPQLEDISKSQFDA